MHRQGSRNEDTVENKMDQVPTLKVLTFNKPYCLYVKILWLCFRAYKQYMEFIIQWDNKKHVTDGRKRYLSQKEETIFIEWGRVLGGRSSNTGMNPYHILKLSQFIIGFFSCIPIPGTLKPNWIQVFQRFTFWLLQIRESHTLL